MKNLKSLIAHTLVYSVIFLGGAYSCNYNAPKNPNPNESRVITSPSTLTSASTTHLAQENTYDSNADSRTADFQRVLMHQQEISRLNEYNRTNQANNQLPRRF
jgi:hypothetical protein